MTLRSYIVDFAEPVQLVEAYHSYLANHSFLLRTDDNLALSQRVRIRFNLLNGAGVTLTGKVVSEVRPDGFGIQLPDTDDTAWLVGQAKTAARKLQPHRRRPTAADPDGEEATGQTTRESTGETMAVPEEHASKAPPHRPAQGPVPSTNVEHRPSSVPSPPSPDPRYAPEVTQRLPQPTSRPHSSGPFAEHDEATGEDSGELGFAHPEAKPDPTQSGIRKPAVPMEPNVDMADRLAPSGEELMRRIRAMDQAVQKRANVTMQEPVGSGPSPRHEERSAAQQVPKLSTEALAFRDRVKKLKQKEKLQLAITGGEQIRRILMEQDEPQVHLWVFKNPRLSEPEAIEFTEKPGLSSEVVEFILRSPRWSNVSSVLMNLLLNPRTPASAYRHMILSLHHDDLRHLAGSAIHPPEAVSLAREMLTSK